MIDRQESDTEAESEPEQHIAPAGPSRHLYAAPTVQEIQQLRSGESSGGTSFSLQLEALLSSTLVQPNPSLKELLTTIHSTILALPLVEALPPAKALKRLGAHVPLVGPSPPLDAKWTLGYDKPEEIFIGGSWGVVGGYKKGKGEQGGVDLVVVMPKLDHRYFYKRLYYLGVILKAVKGTWGLAMEDAKRPVVVVDAKGYATSIAHDTLHKQHLLHLHRMSQLMNTPTVASYLAMWRIWARRRGLPRHRGGSAWFAAMLLAWVVDGGERGAKKVRGPGKGVGHWGAMRAAWELLAHTDFEQTPVSLARDDQVVIDPVDGPRMTDPTGTVNLLGGWELGEVQILQHHARETLAMLEGDADADADAFRQVFLRDLKPTLVFDEVIQVEPGQELPDEVAHVLRRGLSDRVKIVHVSDTIGLIYNPETATRVIDIGPSSEAKADCQAFRELWGDRAELRRFKDGSINESVVWELSRPEEAASIPARIVAYLLDKHFHITAIVDDSWQTILQLPATARDAVSVPNSYKQGFRPTMTAYDELYRVLKDVDAELPLAILNVTPCSELLRYSSTFVPHPIDVNRLPSAPQCISYVPYADVVIQFESSPKWPDDLAAIQKVKLALLDKLSGVISQRMGVNSTIVFERTSEIEDHAALELVLNGVAFRLRVYHDKERTLLERIIDDEPVFATTLPRPPRRLAAPALEAHIHRFVHLPSHHSSIAPMHHRYPSYSTATRLLKRWFAAHMLSQVTPEAAELIMARVYLHPGTLQTPCSATTGFFRAIDLLANWEWRTEPVYVPIFSVKEATTQRVRFPDAPRQDKANEGWVIITEQDESGHRWTRGITKVVAGRINALARATLSAQLDTLFTTPLDYDFLLHLSPSVLPRYAQGIASDPDEWESKLKFRNIHQDLRVGFDPVQSLLADLQRIYPHAVVFFHDVHGGGTIGGIWAPNPGRTLKAFLGWSSKPEVSRPQATPLTSKSSLVHVNREAILGEISRLGRGIIERVERHN
ncbi:hypothetical protein IAU60_004904 [Kwoniella sp. DSM 27419]